MKWTSIRTKLIVFMILPIALCIIAVMFISYSLTTESLKTRAVEENTNLLYQGYRNIDSLLGEINRISLTVYSDSEFYRLLNAGYDDMSANIDIYASLNYIYKSMPDIFQVYLFGVKDSKATLITQNIPKRWQGAAPYKGSVPPQGEVLAVEGTHMSHLYGMTLPFQQATYEQVFSLHRRIEQIPSDTPLGYLSIDVKLTALQDIVEQLYDRNEEKLYITDDAGRIVYADQPERIGRALYDSWYTAKLAGSPGEQGSFEENGSMFIYQRIDHYGAHWTLIKEIPKSYLLREANQAVTINLMLFGLALLVILTATILISIRVTAPIKRLSNYMSQVKTGNLNVDVLPAGNDEVGLLTERFRTMMDTINNLILREYKLELSSKNNQLRALQAQINPHFLNNTLQIIGTLALELKVPQIYTLISSLAKMMHYSMHSGDRIVTLKDELEHVKAYVELQKERFENRFAYRCEVTEPLLQVAMPKLILQPIMENYFKHGIDRAGTDGWVRLAAARTPDGLIQITVDNNGASIPEDKLARLQRKLRELSDAPQESGPGNPGKEPGSSSIGLMNVLTRLRLVYGDEAALTVTNLEPAGVRITLIMPAQPQ